MCDERHAPCAEHSHHHYHHHRHQAFSQALRTSGQLEVLWADLKNNLLLQKVSDAWPLRGIVQGTRDPKTVATEQKPTSTPP